MKLNKKSIIVIKENDKDYSPYLFHSFKYIQLILDNFEIEGKI